MADFKIKSPIWKHSRQWLPGQEGALQKAGFTEADKARNAAGGIIEWKPRKAAEPDPAEQAPTEPGAADASALAPPGPAPTDAALRQQAQREARPEEPADIPGFRRGRRGQ